MKLHARSIIAIAAVTFAVQVLMPISSAEEQALAMLANGISHRPWFLAIAILIGMPIAFAIPSLRASFMGQFWKVPSTAYVIPRGVLRVFAGMVVGQAIAFLALGLWRDDRFLWLFAQQFLIGGAFCIGAWLRFRRPPTSEFVMRWWPRF